MIYVNLLCLLYNHKYFM